VLVVPITSRAGPLRIALPEEPALTGLREPSFAKCETVGPLHKSLLKARIGSLPPAAWPAIESGLKRVLGLPEP
jgi:mRNA-degrading endonuclease toxin of MazEF toxin-antitoxin module